jgi:hypothetical protein
MSAAQVARIGWGYSALVSSKASSLWAVLHRAGQFRTLHPGGGGQHQ